MSYQRFCSNCFLLSIVLLFSSNVRTFAAAPDYLKMQQLLTYLDSKPDLFADPTKNRVAFCAAKESVASDSDVRRNGSMSDEDRMAAIKWVTEFSMEQVLFAKEDMESLLKQISEMPKADAQAWHRNSVNIRVIAKTPEWEVTNQWLNDFWAVQAIYKDDQIKEFQEKLSNLTPIGVSVVMEHMVSVLAKRVQRQQVAATRRQSYQFASPTSTAQRRSTSGTPAGGFYSPPTRTALRSVRRAPQSISRQVSRAYIYRGPVLFTSLPSN